MVCVRAGWSDIRLLAPRAELRLLLTGDTTLIDSSRLSYLGEALRALLVFEMRGLVVRMCVVSMRAAGTHCCTDRQGTERCRWLEH